MKTQEQIWELFVGSNPIPDLDEQTTSANGGATYLVALQQRESQEPPPPLPPSRRRIVWVAAAAVTIAVGLATILLNMTQPETPPVTQPTPTTVGSDTSTPSTTPTTEAPTTTIGVTRDAAAEAAAIEIAQGALDAFNSGDVDTWVDIRFRGSIRGLAGGDNQIGQLRLEVQALLAADGQYSTIDCQSSGYSEWDVREAGPALGYLVVCETVLTNAFHAAGGIDLEEQLLFLIDNEEIIAVTEGDGENQEAWAFTADFAAWAIENHPEETGLFYFGVDEGEPRIPRAESMATALALIDEFVQSQP